MEKKQRQKSSAKRNNDIFKKRLDELLFTRGIQNQELAWSIYVSPSTVSGWRTGYRMPDVGQIILIQVCFGCPVIIYSALRMIHLKSFRICQLSLRERIKQNKTIQIYRKTIKKYCNLKNMGYNNLEMNRIEYIGMYLEKRLL